MSENEIFKTEAVVRVRHGSRFFVYEDVDGKELTYALPAMPSSERERLEKLLSAGDVIEIHVVKLNRQKSIPTPFGHVAGGSCETKA